MLDAASSSLLGAFFTFFRCSCSMRAASTLACDTRPLSTRISPIFFVSSYAMREASSLSIMVMSTVLDSSMKMKTSFIASRPLSVVRTMSQET